MRRFALFCLLFPWALSAQEECDVFSIQDLSAAYLNFSVDTIILQPDGSFEVQLSNGTTFIQVQGCTDTSYTEYNAAANTDDGSCATPVVEGCTDPDYQSTMQRPTRTTRLLQPWLKVVLISRT